MGADRPILLDPSGGPIVAELPPEPLVCAAAGGNQRPARERKRPV
jgi:hypothetical protein